MNASIRALTAIGVLLAIPLFAIPVLGAPRMRKDIRRRIIASRIWPKQVRS